jgi:hypothetical protein
LPICTSLESTALAEAPRKSTLSWPLEFRKRKSSSQTSSDSVALLGENGHSSDTTPSTKAGELAVAVSGVNEARGSLAEGHIDTSDCASCAGACIFGSFGSVLDWKIASAVVLRGLRWIEVSCTCYMSRNLG